MSQRYRYEMVFDTYGPDFHSSIVFKRLRHCDVFDGPDLIAIVPDPVVAEKIVDALNEVGRLRDDLRGAAWLIRQYAGPFQMPKDDEVRAYGLLQMYGPRTR